MQALSRVKEGTYTIKWMFGVPEILSMLREGNVREGNQVQVIARRSGGMIIGAEDRRFAVGTEVTDRIQV